MAEKLAIVDQAGRAQVQHLTLNGDPTVVGGAQRVSTTDQVAVLGLPAIQASFARPEQGTGRVGPMVMSGVERPNGCKGFRSA